ncbi:TraB/GumN family protein [Sphingomonas sp.]|uniref:TraB/GumN family protein n=1 Tax=Sphingomonas sp. TaxID=28214 RepID=UPI001D2B44E9|nr:TraB/GumN family protein [Sphingomonas sp.]MBX9797577.1 TraB/GumN family protein [Sphingomonas sp.]
MKMRLLEAATTLALCLAGPLFAQSSTPATTAAAPAKAAHPALWVVKDADTTLYLFGTIHVLKPGYGWFDGAVKKAFDESKLLVLELPDADEKAAQPLVMKLATATDGKTLTARLPEPARDHYVKAMTGLGLPPQAFDTFEPWFAAVNLGLIPALKAGYDPNSGAEKTLTAAAKAQGKRIAGFETLEQQLGYFDTMPIPLQIKFLDETAKESGKASETLDKMVTQWAAGDPEALGRTINQGMRSQPEVGRLLLADRNKRWAAVIKDMMAEPGTVFIAVGAGHLAGADSVQAQLKRYRLSATRITQ